MWLGKGRIIIADTRHCNYGGMSIGYTSENEVPADRITGDCSAFEDRPASLFSKLTASKTPINGFSTWKWGGYGQ